MSADRWIEARADPDYFLVEVDRLEASSRSSPRGSVST
jgi:hypothetical protein